MKKHNVQKMGLTLYCYYLRNDIFRYHFVANDWIILALLISTTLGKLRATFPWMALKSTDTMSAFRPSSNNLFAAFYLLIFYGVGFILRVIFVFRTPNVIWAPLLEDKKFSHDPDEYLQNSMKNFIWKSCYNESSPTNYSTPCMPDDSIPEYYKKLYTLEDGTGYFELANFTSVRNYNEDIGVFFFSFDPADNKYTQSLNSW